jgi:hypothetical protein
MTEIQREPFGPMKSAFFGLQFLRVKISECTEHPHLLGREALVEVRHAVVELVAQS